MPIYAYRCESCGHAKDVLQKISDPLLTTCPSCGVEAFKKQVTSAGFQLKGSGWYVTDFRGGAASKPSEGSQESGKENTKENTKENGKETGKETGKEGGSTKSATDKSADAPASSASAVTPTSSSAPSTAPTPSGPSGVAPAASK